jgi:superfamily II DNA helicase RecQ
MALARLVAEGSSAKIVFKDFFRQDLRGADIVYLFLTPTAMPKVEKKLKAELKKGSRVISYTFSIPGLALSAVDKQSNRQTVYSYII